MMHKETVKHIKYHSKVHASYGSLGALPEFQIFKKSLCGGKT
jgi:hypothetical protein